MSTFRIPIAKGGTNAFVEIDTDALAEDDLKYVVLEGLKAICNARMSKVGAVSKLEGAELASANAAAMRIAEENKAKLLAGELRSKAKGRKAKSDISREVQTEARRIAREMVKNLIRANGGKVSVYKASEITAAADQMIAEDSTIVEKARENLANRANIAVPSDILAGLHADPTLVAKAEKKKAEAKAARKDGPLSAKQAGMTKGHVPPRQRPAPEHHNVH